jgi:hypothetical protein
VLVPRTARINSPGPVHPGRGQPEGLAIRRLGQRPELLFKVSRRAAKI